MRVFVTTRIRGARDKFWQPWSYWTRWDVLLSQVWSVAQHSEQPVICLQSMWCLRYHENQVPQNGNCLWRFSNEGDVMPLHINEQNVRLSSDGYVKPLTTVVKPWPKRVASGEPYVLQQDLAPCNTFGESQKWWSENFNDFINHNFWPLIVIPWITMCGTWLRITPNRPIYNSKAKLRKVFENLVRNTVRNACPRFWDCLKNFVEADKGYIK